MILPFFHFRLGLYTLSIHSSFITTLHYIYVCIHAQVEPDVRMYYCLEIQSLDYYSLTIV
jgi:hypothetical protein